MRTRFFSTTVLGIIFLIATTSTLSQTRFYPNATIGDFHSFPYISVAGGSVVLVGYTNDIRPVGPYSVLHNTGNGWLNVTDNNTGWKIEDPSFVTCVCQNIQGDIVAAGDRFLAVKTPTSDTWSNYVTDSANVERQFTSCIPFNDGVLLPSATNVILSRDTVLGVVRSVAEMYYELYFLSQTGLRRIASSSPGSRLIELGSIAVLDGIAYVGYRRGQFNDPYELLRITGEGVTLVDVIPDAPLFSTPHIVAMTDGTLSVIYPATTQSYTYTKIIRWHPTRGVVFEREYPDGPRHINNAINVDDKIVAGSAAGSIWVADDGAAKYMFLSSIAGNLADSVTGTRSLAIDNGDVFITTNIGLFVFDKESFSNVLSVDIDLVTSHSLVFPNPSNTGEVTVTVPTSEVDFISFASVTGEFLRIPYSITATAITFDVSDVAPGVYYIMLTSNHGQIVRQVTVL